GKGAAPEKAIRRRRRSAKSRCAPTTTRSCSRCSCPRSRRASSTTAKTPGSGGRPTPRSTPRRPHCRRRARWSGRSKGGASSPDPLPKSEGEGGLMSELVTVSLLNGVVYGLLLFMLSSGLTLIFSMMGVLNFAHASVFMLGAYLSFQFGRWVGFWPALVIAPLVCALVGAAIERYGLRPGHPNGHAARNPFLFRLP